MIISFKLQHYLLQYLHFMDYFYFFKAEEWESIMHSLYKYKVKYIFVCDSSPISPVVRMSVSHKVTNCQIVFPLLAFPCLSSIYLPFLTFPCLSLPFLTFPYLSLPFLTFPYLFVPFLSLNGPYGALLGLYWTLLSPTGPHFAFVD